VSAFTEAGKPEGFRNHWTVAELARFLGVSDRTIERWYKSETIPAPAHVTEAGWKLWSPAQATEILKVRQAKVRKRKQ
jgi:DNA-binding transcriptional MerR regulator